MDFILHQIKNQNIKNLLFYTMVLISFFLIFLDFGVRFDFLVLSIFLMIGIISLYGIFLSIDDKSYSLNKTFCLFYFLFFSIAPAIQFKNSTSFFIKTNLSKEIYLKSGFILLAILFLYLIGYHFLIKYFNKRNAVKLAHPILNSSKDKTTINLKLFYFITVVSFAFYLFLIKFDWNLLIFRPFSFRLKYNTNLGLIGYSILLIIQFIPVVILLYYKLFKNKNDFHTYFFLLIVLLISFPSSLSRGLLAIIYIPIFLLFVPQLRKGINYVLMFMVGLLVIFPIFNNFRHLKEGVFKFNYELFNTAHFDAFQNFSLLINESIITNGRQLLGSLFFFIQESQWPNRPNGTGHLLGETVGYSYLNVAMPYFGEGFANWGYIGILIFLMVILLFNAIFDFYIKDTIQSLFLKSLFYFMLGFEFYLMRGDLMSSVKIFMSLSIAILFVEILRFFDHKWRIKKDHHV